MNTFKYLLTITFLLIISNRTIAQDFENEVQKEITKIHNHLSNDLKWELTPDSNMYIAFAFKIHVQKNTESKLKSISISSNDTIAHKIFPNYNLLKSFNYSLFLTNREEADFIIPVFIDLADSGKKTTREYLVDYYNKSVFGKSYSEAIKLMFYMDQAIGNNHLENYIYLRPFVAAMEKRIQD